MRGGAGDLSGDVEDELTAERHVEDLAAPADAEDRDAARFRIAWDSTEHIAPLARACLRNKPLRKVVTAIIGIATMVWIRFRRFPPLLAAYEQKPAKEGTVEAWGRSPENPLGGWYGLKKGLRGRFGVYVPPLMEALGLCELEHNPKNNRMRAKRKA